MDTSEPSDTIGLDRILEELRQLREENSQLREETARIIALLDGTDTKQRKNEAGWRKKKPVLVKRMLEIGYLNSEAAGLSSQDWNRARRDMRGDHPDWVEEDLGRMGKVLRLPTTPIERVRSGMINRSSSPMESDQRMEEARATMLRKWGQVLARDPLRGPSQFIGWLSGPANIDLIKDGGFQTPDEAVDWCKDRTTER